MRTALVLASLLVPNVAFADALPPQLPIRCPPNSSVVHDHGGTRCVENAPKNCPAGWIGVSGGKCVLEVCGAADTCRGGNVCKPVDLCSHEEMSLGATETLRHGLLAAPPRPRHVLIVSGVCGADRSCGAGDSCVASGVCLPAKLAAPAAKPANAGPSVHDVGLRAPLPPVTVDASAPPPPDASADPTPTAQPVASVDVGVPEEPRPPGKSGGCAGCATSSSRGDLGAIGLVIALATLVVRRRRG